MNYVPSGPGEASLQIVVFPPFSAAPQDAARRAALADPLHVQLPPQTDEGSSDAITDMTMHE